MTYEPESTTSKPNHSTPAKNVSKKDSPSKNKSHDGDEAFNPVRGEMALWAAVITQALMDAGSESKKMEARHEKAKAIRWLLGNSEDFITVCLNAGLDPDYVRNKAKKAIANGCNWREGLASQRAQRRDEQGHASSCPPLEFKRLASARSLITATPVRLPTPHVFSAPPQEWRMAG